MIYVVWKPMIDICRFGQSNYNTTSNRRTSSIKQQQSMEIIFIRTISSIFDYSKQIGTIKYFGSVPFGVNLWYGIELDEPTGKHDGCVGGIRYFTCPPNRGTLFHIKFHILLLFFRDFRTTLILTKTNTNTFFTWTWA